MPNWCSSSVTFYSPNKEVIEEMHRKFVNIYDGPASVPNGFGNGWMGDFVAAFFPEYRPEDIECRGSVEEAEGVKEKQGFWYFSILTLTAWSPKVRLWYEIAKSFYPGVKVAYISEESGCAVYCKWDEEDCFYQDDFCVDICYPDKDGTEVTVEEKYSFHSEKEIFAWLDENMPFKYHKTTNLYKLSEEVENRIIAYAQRKGFDGCYWCDINRFDEVHPTAFDFFG